MPTAADWKRFLFGTPKRMTVTVLLFTLTFVLVFEPNFLNTLAEVIIEKIVKPIFMLLIIALVGLMLLGKVKAGVGLGGKKKGRH